MERNQVIDAFRAYAIFGVMMCHYLGRPDSYGYHSDLTSEWYIGRHAVDVFFVISGFVIAMTVLRSDSAGNFLFRRFARLFPSFLVCSAITFILTWLIGPKGLEVSVVDYLLSLVLLAKRLSHNYTDAVYWTLAIEAEFYLLVAFSFWLFGKNFLWGILLGAALGLTGRYMGFFLIGISAYYFYNAQKEKGWIAGVVGLLIFALYSRHLAWLDNVYIFLSIGSLLAALFFLNNLKLGPIAWIGRVSYPLYLLHANIGLGVIALCIKSGLPEYVGILTASAVTLLIAVFVHYYVEMPGRTFLLSRFNFAPVSQTKESATVSP